MNTPLVVAVVSGATYFLVEAAKRRFVEALADLGRLAFAVGLLAYLLHR